MNESKTEWWGKFNFQLGASIRWQIGQLRIAVHRTQSEWLVAHEQIEVEDEQMWKIEYKDQVIDEIEATTLSRFVCQTTSDKLNVLPALADRSVVTRPYTPFTVLAGEITTIYVSTPLWLTISSPGTQAAWFETPIQRPPDTWFGPSTMEGETCYSSRTFGRLNLDNLTAFPHRAFTQVHIRNNSAEPLFIERLNLPVTYLSIFNTKEKVLWTESVTMMTARGSSMAEMNIEKRPPPTITDPKLVVPPRQVPQKGMIVRAFGALRLSRLG